MDITKRQIVTYTLLPGIIPRMKELFGSGFSYLVLLIAVIYRNFGLLPASHPYCNPQNIGKFGLRHVIVAASSQLVFNRQNIDKVVVFFTILAGLAIIFLQLILLVLSLLSLPVFAGTWTDTFLQTPFGEEQDIAFIVLDQVFGVMDIFGGAFGFFESCYSKVAIDCININGNPYPSPTAFPLPFHIALHEMFRFYSIGISFIAMFLIIYLVIAVVGETIVEGTPFGKRFNKAWVIPRLIMFFALIAPLDLTDTNGISGGQYVVLSAAKYGSNMATNAWTGFSNEMNAAYAGDGTSTMFGAQASMISFPNVPSVANLSQFMFLVRMCMYAEKIMHNTEIIPYIVRKPIGEIGLLNPFNDRKLFFEFFAAPDGAPIDNSFYEALEFSRFEDVVLRFGHSNIPAEVTADVEIDDVGGYNAEWGYIKPTCGELVFKVDSVPVKIVDGAPVPANGSDPVVTGFIDGVDGLGIQENYFLSIQEYLMFDPIYDVAALCMVRAVLPYDHDPRCVDDANTFDYNDTGLWDQAGTGEAFPIEASETNWLTRPVAKNSIDYYDTMNRWMINGNFSVGTTVFTQADVHYPDSIIGVLRQNYDLGIPNAVLQHGWVGASAYYTQIANINGIITDAVQNIPIISKYPAVMEEVSAQHAENDSGISRSEKFSPMLQSGKLVDFKRSGDAYVAAALYNAHRLWSDDYLASSVNKKPTGNVFVDVINWFFGTNGLFNALENREVHPLALLSGLGKSMLDASIRNIIGGTVTEVGAGLLDKLFNSDSLAATGSLIGGVLTKIGMIGIVIGFTLYYALPFLPFIYFFFAFGGWIKSIFEAMVAVPLWAMAHIKIDGNGLPGPWATNGYFLIFEIFLRPTLIIFGFLASFIVFAALVSGLNIVYSSVLMSVSGYDLEAQVFNGLQYTEMGRNTLELLRGPIDQLFYTVIYVILVYMIGQSCFKMIDQVPKGILRFMGATVSTFQEHAEDPGAKFMHKMGEVGHIGKGHLNYTIEKVREIGRKRDGDFSEEAGDLAQKERNRQLMNSAFGSSPSAPKPRR